MAIKDFEVTQGLGSLQVDGTEVSRHTKPTEAQEAAAAALDAPGQPEVVYHPAPIRFDASYVDEGGVVTPPAPPPEQPAPPAPQPPPALPPHPTITAINPNMVPGLTTSLDFRFDEDPPWDGDQHPFEGRALGPLRAKYWGGTPGAIWRRIQDPSAPFGADVLEQVTPPGMSGSGCFSLTHEFPIANEVYVAWCVKWDPDFEWNGTSNKQIWFNLADNGVQTRSSMFQFHWGNERFWGIPMDPTEPTASPSQLSANLMPWTGSDYQAPQPADGEWHLFEIYMNALTGTVQWWRDGQMRANHVDRNVRQTYKITIDDTWGGGGSKQTYSSRYSNRLFIATR